MTFEAIIGSIAIFAVTLAGLVVAIMGNREKTREIERLKGQGLRDAADRQTESEIDNEERENLAVLDAVRDMPNGPGRLARAIEESRKSRARTKRELERRYGCAIGPDGPSNRRADSKRRDD